MNSTSAALTGAMALDPPIKSLFVYNSNPVSQEPAAGQIVEGLKAKTCSTVVSELFITDTAKYADILLPATMQAEQYDLMVTWGHLRDAPTSWPSNHPANACRTSSCSAGSPEPWDTTMSTGR
jgi:anaerobic selenocysteine-containing dehydrogenase